MDQTPTSSQLQFFPVPIFAIIMGLTGLAITYIKAHEVLHYPQFIGDILQISSLILFALFLMIYFCKMIFFPKEVINEITHPIRINFFATISISFLLQSISFFDSQKVLAEIFFYLGTSLHLIITIYTMRFWIKVPLELNNLNPAWLIPIVGNVIIPISGIHFAPIFINIFFFSIGFFFWPILFTIIFKRIIFHAPMPEKLLPTFFIFIAPAAVAFISYVKIQQHIFALTTIQFSLDFFACFLYCIALFFTLLCLSMSTTFLKIKFALTWWAYTFPLAAITIASILMLSLMKNSLLMPANDFFLYLINFLILLTTLLVAIIAIKTAILASKKEICVKE